MKDKIIQLTEEEQKALVVAIDLIDNLELTLSHAEVQIRDKKTHKHFVYPQARDLSDYTVFLRQLYYGEVVIFDEEED